MITAYIIGLTTLFFVGAFITYSIGVNHGTQKERKAWQNFVNLLRKANGL